MLSVELKSSTRLSTMIRYKTSLKWTSDKPKSTAWNLKQMWLFIKHIHTHTCMCIHYKAHTSKAHTHICLLLCESIRCHLSTEYFCTPLSYSRRNVSNMLLITYIQTIIALAMRVDFNLNYLRVLPSNENAQRSLFSKICLIPKGKNYIDFKNKKLTYILHYTHRTYI